MITPTIVSTYRQVPIETIYYIVYKNVHQNIEYKERLHTNVLGEL